MTYEDKPTAAEMDKLKHLTNKSTITTADIKSALHPFETDIDSHDAAAGVTAFHQAYGVWPSESEQQWINHVTFILQRAPTQGEIKQAARGPQDFEEMIRNTRPPRSSRAYAATVHYDYEYPSYRMAQTQPELTAKWQPVTQKWYHRAIEEKEGEYKTIEQAKQEGIKIIRHVRVFKTKEEGTLKFRHTPDEQPTAAEKARLGNLFAGGIPSEASKLQLAHAAYF